MKRRVSLRTPRRYGWQYKAVNALLLLSLIFQTLAPLQAFAAPGFPDISPTSADDQPEGDQDGEVGDEAAVEPTPDKTTSTPAAMDANSLPVVPDEPQPRLPDSEQHSPMAEVSPTADAMSAAQVTPLPSYSLFLPLLASGDGQIVTPSPTATTPATRTVTATATTEPTHTVTSTATATTAPTHTSTATRTVTVEPTRTATRTATVTAPVITPTTPTAAPSHTATATPVGSSTATATAPATRTPTPTRTATVTGQPTNTATRTPTVTATRTSTVTRTATVTGEPTHTVTVTPTPTSTGTPIPTVSITPTNTPTASVTATATQTGRPNQAPQTADQTYTLPVTNTVTATLDLVSLATDADGDPLTFTLVDQPLHGSAEIVTSTLTYSTSTIFQGVDEVLFEVNDGFGGIAQGTVRFTYNRTQLHVTPGGILLTEAGDTHTFEVTAYDGAGIEVDAADLELEWISTDPTLVSVVPTADGLGATITSHRDVGMAFISVRSRQAPDEVASDLVPVTLAQPAEGVELVTDEQIVFPMGDLPPNSTDSPYPVNDRGQLLIGGETRESARTGELSVTPSDEDDIIGGFTTDEITSTFEVISETGELLYPVVVGGTPPITGTIILASESAPVMGRVVRHVLQRGDKTLLQVQLVNFVDAYRTLNVDFSIQELIASGYASREQFITVVPDDSVPFPSSFTPQRGNEFAALAAAETSCEGKFGDAQGTLVGVEFKPIISFDPDLDVGLILSENDLGSYVESARFIAALKAKVGAQLGVNFQMAGSLPVLECSLGPKLAVGLPNAGIMALINIALGPRLEFQPKAAVSLAVQAGPRVGLGPKLEFGIDLKGGFTYANPTGRDGAGEFQAVKGFEYTPLADIFSLNADGFQDIGSEFGQAKIGLSISVAETGTGVLRVGGAMWDFLERLKIGGSMVEQFAAHGTIDLLEVSVGPQFTAEWASPELVANTRNNGTAAKLDLVGKAGIKSRALGLIQQRIGITRPFVLDITIIEVTWPGWSWYDELKPSGAQVLPSTYTKKDRTVTFEVVADGPDLIDGDVYWNGEVLTTLTRQGNKLTGTWRVTDEFCQASAESSDPDGKVKLQLIGHNWMLNGTFFNSLPMPEFMKFAPAANFLGEVELSCQDLSVNLTIEPDPATLRNNTITACIPQSGIGEYTLGASAEARDEAGQIQRLSIDIVPGTLLGAIRTPLTEAERSRLQVPHRITLRSDLHEQVQLFAEVVAAPATAGGSDRTKRTEPVTLSIEWATCSERTEMQARTTRSLCTENIEARERTIKQYLDPQTGELIREEPGPWGAWKLYSSQPTGACTAPARGGGDPHIATPDGTEYDSFALGEFTYLQPIAGEQGITVQARHQRVGQVGNLVFHPWTSWISAMAFEADGTVVEFNSPGFGGAPLNEPLVNGVREVLAPGLHIFGEVEIKVNSATDVEWRYGGYRFMITQVLTFLEFRSVVPQDGSHHGMLGTPNGDAGDDLRLPDGMPVQNPFDLANGWRVTERARSLFTYGTGQGPDSFNQPQINEPPSPQELAPYVAQARTLLESTCRFDGENQVAINNAALELYTGRAPEELARSGLCWYGIQGRVTNELVPGLAVPGAKVTITSNQLDSCETYTDQQGDYACYMPAMGSLPEVTIRVSGRGSGEATTTFDALPPANGTIGLLQNFDIAPTTIQLNGVVEDRLSRPLYNAQVRSRGPEGSGFSRAFAEADGNGAFQSYLMLDDGVMGGDVNYHIVYNPSWSSVSGSEGVSVLFDRALPVLRSNELNVISETLTIRESLVRFSGQVGYSFDPTQTIPGMRVAITPTTAIEGWNGCEVVTLAYSSVVRNPRTETNDGSLVGSYVCDVPLDRDEPFQAEVSLLDFGTSQIVTVDPAGTGAGEVLPVITSFTVPTAMLRLSGVVRGPNGAPISGAAVSASGDTLSGSLTALTGPNGAYALDLALRAGQTVAVVDLGVTYGNAEVAERVTFSQLEAEGINYRLQDWTLEGSELHFTGRVYNSLAYSTVLTGTVAISSTLLGQLCETTISAFGLYSCEASISENSGPADLEYHVTGPWGSVVDTGRIEALPPLGASATVVREIGAQATTLRLRGTVRSVGGDPLPGATVQVAGGLNEVQGKSGEDGSYDLLVTLGEDITNARLTYTVAYRTTTTTETETIEVVPLELNEATRDFEYGYRVATFRGVVRNPYNLDLPFSQIEIESPALSRACLTQTAADGSYFCAAEATAEGTFTATYTISGFWGSYSVEEEIAVDPDLGSVDHYADFTVTPTALHLRGRITSPTGTPLEGVHITATGTPVYRESIGVTGANGQYDFYVILKQAQSEAFDGTLTYRIGYGTATNTRLVPFTAQANQSSDLYQDFTMDARTIQFRGVVRNALIDPVSMPQGSLVRGTRVVVTSPTLGRLCEWGSLERFNTAEYRCDAPLFTDQPFEVQYYLSGAWGSETITDTVSTIPSPGTAITINKTLEVRPPTLTLNGEVTDRDGAPIRDAAVTVSSPQLVGSVSVRTDGNGRYFAAVLARGSVTTATLNYQVSVWNESPQSLTRDVTIVPAALVQHEEDFQFTLARRVRFEGQLSNLTDPALKLNGVLQIVSPTLDQTLCNVSVSEGSYRCETLVRTDDAYMVNYRLTAEWGTITLLNQGVPAGAESFQRDFAAEPRVIRVEGAVLSSDGTRLPGALVRVSSASVVPGRDSTVSDTTDGNGEYSGSFIVAEGVNAGTLAYLAESNSNASTSQATFAFTETALITVTHDVELSTRAFVFEGRFFNSLLGANSNVGNTRVVLSSQQLGHLCEAYGSARYECRAVVNASEPFSVTYDLFGDWGSASYTTSVTNLPPVGGEGTVYVDVPFSPAMLRVNGRVEDHAGAPLAGVRVASPSSSISAVLEAGITDEDGDYSLLFLLKAISGTQSGVLPLEASHEGAVTRVNVAYSATEASQESVNAAPIVMRQEVERRLITISGDLINTLAPGIAEAAPTGNARYLAPDGGSWCPATRATTLHCAITVYDDAPLLVNVVVSGDWGTVSRSVEIAEIPEPGQSKSVEVDIEVTATTVHYTGRVTLPGGSPLENASVQIEAIQDGLLLARAAARTTADGTYDAYVVLPGAARNASLVYTVNFDGFGTSYTISPFSAASNQLTLRTEHFSFVQRRVRFTGTLTNGWNEGRPLPGRVTISSPDFFSERYCDANVSAQGTFSCDAFLESSDPFSVTYRVVAPWGTLDVPGFVDDVTGPGGTTIVEQPIVASPTTLRLTGTLSDPTTAPLAGATVRATSEALLAAGQAVTDESGRYTMTLVLNANVNQGDLAYVITYHSARLAEEFGFFGLQLNRFNTLERDFVLATRELSFNGQLTSRLVDGMPIPARVTISSPTEGELCSAETDDEGGYHCTVRAVTADPFTATYEVSGDWGAESSEAAVGPGVVGTHATITRDLTAAPTTLHLTGIVQTPQGDPLEGVRVSFAGSDLSTSSTDVATETDEFGRYSADVLLQAERLEGTLVYGFRVAETRGTVAVPFTATAGDLTTLDRTIVFSTRNLHFSGLVQNELAPQIVLAGARVEISSPTLGDLCTATSSLDGSYACEVHVLNTEGFEIEYAVVSDWGRTTLSGSVPSGAAGATTSVERLLGASPTTLRVRGIVTDESGAPLAGAEVTASGSNLVASATDITSSLGEYELTVMVRAGIGLETLAFQVEHDGQSLTSRHAYQFEPNQLGDIEQDFTYAMRAFIFHGQLVNNWAPEMQLGAAQVTISSPGAGTLCDASLYGANLYRCQIQYNTTQPLAVQYQFAGDWGSRIITGTTGATLPPIGGTVTVTRELDFSPTTMVITGTVSTSSGEPVEGAFISLRSDNRFSAINGTRGTETDAAGRYELPVILKDGISGGTFTLELSHNGIEKSAPVTVTGAVGGRLNTTQDFTIDVRRLLFWGQVLNQWLLPEEHPVPTDEVRITRVGGGELCAWESSSTNDWDDFDCGTTITDTTAFSVTFTAAGDWGTKVITGTVPAGTLGEETEVEQDVVASPTTIQLVGTTKTTSGQAMANVWLRVGGSTLVLPRGSTGLTARSGADGSYELFGVVDEGVTSGQLSISATASGIARDEQVAFTAASNIVKQTTHDVLFDARRVLFTGRFINQFAPGQPLGAESVSVSTIDGEYLCGWTWIGSGDVGLNYNCAGFVASTGVVSVTYSVQADWGTEIITGSIPAGALGEQTLVPQNLLVTPTTLHLTGTLRDQDGVRRANGEVLVSGGDVSTRNSSPRDFTDNNGNYDFYLVLQEGRTSGELAYRSTLGGAQVEQVGGYLVTDEQPSPVSKDLTFNARSLRFTGGISHETLPWMDVAATRVTVASPVWGELCGWAPGWRDNPSFYLCTAQVETTDAFSVTYTVEGAWGTMVVSGTVPVDGWGVQTNVTKELGVNPTTLRLHGLVTNDQGQPLLDATVAVSGEGLLAGGSDETGSNGAYEIFVLLEDGATAGDLTYRVSYESASATHTESFSVPANQVTSVLKNVVFVERQLNFSGQIVNRLGADTPLGATSVQVRAAGQATPICSWQLPYWQYPTDSYGCSASVLGLEAMTVTYTVSGDWGTGVVTGTVPGGTVGGSTNVIDTLALSPATLHLTGRVSDSSDASLGEANIYFSTTNTAESAGNLQSSTVTRADGRYDLYIALKSSRRSGTINLSAHFGDASDYAQRTFSVPVGQRVTLEQDFTMRQRFVEFRGYIRNAFWPDMTVEATEWTIRSQTRGELCRGEEQSGQSYYYCQIALTDTVPFSVTYSAAGDWGSEIITGTGTIVPPAIGSTAVIERDLPVSPTTVRFRGIVSNPDGTPRSGMSVNVASGGDIFSENASILAPQSGSNGIYTTVAILKEGATGGTIEYTVNNPWAYYSIRMTDTQEISATAHALTEVERDFTFSARRLEFRGTIANQFASAGVPIRRLEVHSQNGLLCSNSYWGTTSYYCEATVHNTTPLELTYVVSGDWGSATVPGQTVTTIPAVGESSVVNQVLTVAPTTLQVTGTVSDTLGAPLSGVSVSLFSNDFVGSASTSSVTTGSDGTYSFTVVLKEGITTGTFEINGSYGGVSFTRLQSYTAAANFLTAIPTHVTFTERRLTFSGRFRNAHAPDASEDSTNVLARRVVVSSPGLGQLCEYNTGYYGYSSRTYSCTATVQNDTPISVTYTVSADWGTSVITDTVDNFPAAGQTSTINENLAVQPATVHLFGQVTDGGGAPLQGVRVEARSWDYGSLPNVSYIWTTTDADGQYHLYAVPQAGYTSGSYVIRAETEYGGATASTVVPFAALAPGELLDQEADLLFDVRRVSFGGEIRNTLAPGQTVVSSVDISSTVGFLCEDVESSYYGCYADVQEMDAFPITYTLSGGWGSAIFTDTVPAGTVGSSTAMVRDFSVTATTIRLRGVVTRADGGPLEHGWIEATGGNTLQEGWVYLDDMGAYDLYVPVDNSPSGTFTVTVEGDEATIVRTITYTATVGALNDLTRDLTFDTRYIDLGLELALDEEPDLYLEFTRAEVSAPGMGTLCEQSDPYGDSYFWCELESVTEMGAFTVTYTFESDWGTVTRTGVIEAGDIDSYTYHEETLTATPTTLRLSGTLTDPDGTGLESAYMEPEGDLVSNHYELNGNHTMGDGSYDFYVVLKEGVTAGELPLHVSYDYASMSTTIPFTSTENAVTDVVSDILFDVRALYLTGDFFDGTTGEPVAASALEISINGVGPVCEDEFQPGSTSFYCYVEAPVEAFEVTYVVEGDWGTATATQSVLSGVAGGLASVHRTIEIDP